MRVLLGLLLAVFVTAAQAADNTVILTPGAGVTMRTKDVGSGVESPLQIPGDTSGNALATAPGTPNASFALPIQGVTGGTAVPISGTVTANAGTNLNTSLLALETGGNLATIAGAVSASVLQTNEKQVNGVTPLMGNGVTGTGSQRVTIASDNTAFSVNANAGTNLNTSALATSANQPTNAAQASTTSGQTGNLIQCAVTTGAPTYTTAQTDPLSCDTAGNVRINVTASAIPTGAATSANQLTEITSLATIATNTGAAIPAGTNLIGNTGEVYPAGSTPITASTTGTTAATTATLAANATLHTYICGLSIRANATGAATGNATVTGTITGTLNFTQWTAPLASGLGIVEQVFKPCIISSTTNTGIAVISAAPGSGGVVSVSAWGYQL